ncbi:MAG: phosphoribosylglycinamide synthetase [Alphaproteobacteria bacterium]|nr:phosphoribosylglycinamide synthetase [Alphaproteobacteria bacterium]MBV9371723.1 phosphoribosylglycinamide synthetase [Alphaproteobacteria bacterium]MBV9902499.1 phosphoribosylglycinamide synthetase [Alphaproteobacteria bacterium]
MLVGRQGPLKVFDEDKERLRLLFLAKHARSGGSPDAEDGTHAVYHHEMLKTLRSIGFAVEAADRYDALYERPDADFVVTLLNRGGFLNSEMLAPLLLARRGLPFLGAAPILRGLGDDKHLMKVVARHLGVPVTEWLCVRRGQEALAPPPFRWERLVVKPNASSASWGVGLFDSWQPAEAHARHILASGHDVILEPWAPLIDVAVPVIGARGPWLLPPMGYFPDEPGRLRSYEEKRGLAASAGDDPLRRIDDPSVVAAAHAHTAKLLGELWPFDYGRFEYRWDPASGALRFMEVNLSCNLWSRKTVSRSARALGLGHAVLVETILAHSLLRQGVIDRVLRVG